MDGIFLLFVVRLNVVPGKRPRCCIFNPYWVTAECYRPLAWSVFDEKVFLIPERI